MNQITLPCVVLLALLTACAPPKMHQVSELNAPQSTTTPRAQQPKITQQSATTLSAFELSGAIAAKHHNKGWTATLSWIQQGPNQYQIRFIGPLSGQTVMIEKQHAVITYREGEKKLTSTNGDDLLQQQTGIHLPVNNLYYWVRGIPAPGAVQSAQRNETNQLTTLKQAGYTMNYTHYMPVGNRTLPNKIQLQGHDMMIKLVIKRWSVL